MEPLAENLDCFMRLEVFKLLTGGRVPIPEQLAESAVRAKAFEKEYNELVVDRICQYIQPYLTPPMQKICAALLLTPTLLCLSPGQHTELVPKTLPAVCPGCTKEWKQTPTKGAEFFILNHEDTIRRNQDVTYPTTPVGFWACTAHAARIRTLHKMFHFVRHIQRDFSRLLPEPIRSSPTTSWESLTGPYNKKPIAKWPTSIKDNQFPLVVAFATHRKTFRLLFTHVESLYHPSTTTTAIATEKE
jgi:hypothetical protein